MSLPRRPADVSHWAPLTELAEQYLRHAWQLTAVRLGQDTGQPPAELVQHALATLAYGHALADRALASRWVNAADALTYGATVAQVAQAMGLDVEEVRVGLRQWAAALVGTGQLTPADRDELLALVQS